MTENGPAIAKLKRIVPPLLWSTAKKIRGPVPEPEKLLFDGDSALFEKITSKAACYGEYGCGQSSAWVAANTDAEMICVDSSNEWIGHVSEQIGPDRADLRWIDCGPLGDWGTPLDYGFRDAFRGYGDALWQDGRSPDVVLIDGRFRVMCFLVSVLNAKSGTSILFDDYTDRLGYHLVEEFVPVSETCGRQALFIVPEKSSLDLDAIQRLSEKFEFVRD